jgi:hypothetical protein
VDKGGFDTEREAWKACREAMRDADRGRIVKPSTRTVQQFLTEWLAAVEPALDATTWRSWSDYARSYVIPHIGAERLQRLDEPQLLKLYGKLLIEGRIKRDNDSVMYAYWSERVAAGNQSTPRQVSEACNTTIHAARTAVRRYRSGIVPKPLPPGLAPKPSGMFTPSSTGPSSTQWHGSTSPTTRQVASNRRAGRGLAERCGSPRRSGFS